MPARTRIRVGIATFVPALIATAAIVFTTIRFGVLAGVAAHVSMAFIGYGLRSADPSSWVFYDGMIAVALVAALGGWGAKTALAGKPLFGGEDALETAGAGTVR